MPNFVLVDETVADIWPFLDFQDGRRPPSLIFTRLEILTFGTV